MILAIETTRHKSIGAHLRTAVAFGATVVIIVGSPLYSTHGAIGAQKRIEVVHFYYWSECLEFVKSMGYSVYAISPTALNTPPVPDIISEKRHRESVPIQPEVFNTNPAMFVVGDKDGLSQDILDISDVVLHVGFPVKERIVEERVPYDSKIGICFYQFARFQKSQSSPGLEEQQFLSGKYYVDKSLNFHNSTTPRITGAAVKEFYASRQQPVTLSEEDIIVGMSNLFYDNEDYVEES